MKYMPNQNSEGIARKLTVFLCYSVNDKDKKDVAELYDWLLKSNIQPWMYLKDMIAGRNWARERENQIETCDVFIPCVSSNFQNTKDGDRHAEVRIALRVAERKKSTYIVPLFLEQVEPIPYEFKDLHFVDYFSENGYQQLIRALEDKRQQLIEQGQQIEKIVVRHPPKKPPSFSDVHNPSKKLSTPSTLFTRRNMLVLGGGVVLSAIGISGSRLIAQSHSPFASRAPTQGKIVSTKPEITTTVTTSMSYIGSLYGRDGTNIRALAWSPDGKKMAVAYDDNVADIWDIVKQEIVYRYGEHEDHVEGVSWSPDGKYIVSGGADGTARIWNEQGATLQVYQGHKEVDVNAHHPWVNRVQWSPDGTKIVSCDQTSSPSATATVQIWDAKNANTLVTYREHKNGVYAVAWSPNGKHIASAGYDGTLRIWKADSGKTEAEYPGSSARFLYGVAWSLDSQYVVFGGDDCNIWIGDPNGSNPLLVKSLPTHKGLGVRDIAFSPKGLYYAVSTDSQGVFIFQSVENSFIYHFGIQDVPGDISALGWSPTGSEIAMGNGAGALNITVQLWKTIIE